MPDYHSYTPERLTSVCAWKEGRGEIKNFGAVSILAIMHVIANRARDWGLSIAHVILGPNQFTSMSVPSDPEFELLPSDEDPIFQACLADATAILAGTDPDESKGAHWYANLVHIDPGGWFKRHIVNDPALHPIIVVIGHHTFFK